MRFYPGIYIAEIIDDDQLDPKQFAKDLQLSPEEFNQLLDGKKAIDETLAKRLEALTSISKGTWLNLQSNYDLSRPS